MKKEKYKFKSGISCPLSAKATHQELERIRETHGNLTAENLLEESASDGATLHDYYEWNDNIAGLKFRIGQSRDLINGIIVITVSDDKSNSKENEKWIGIKISNEDACKKDLHGNTRNYFQREEIINSNELMTKHLASLKSRMMALINRYASYKSNDTINNICSLINSL